MLISMLSVFIVLCANDNSEGGTFALYSLICVLVVLSAVDGIKGLPQDAMVGVSISILIVLFRVPWFSTNKVGFIFAPPSARDFCSLRALTCTIYLSMRSQFSVFQPRLILQYFKRNRKQEWISLLAPVGLCPGLRDSDG